MKIALSQLNYHIGNFAENNQKIIESIEAAQAAGAELIIFAELAISGYPAKDLLRNSDFLQQCYKSIESIAPHCRDIAVLIENGQVQHITKKSLLPDYDVFDEYRYFEPNSSVACIPFQGKTIALTICEDLWDDDGPNSYVGDIMLELAKEKPDLIINIAASPFSYTHFESRKNVLKRNVIKANAPLIYVNQVGAHTDIIFDGRSLALNKKSEVILELKSFEEDIQYVEFVNNDLQGAVPHQELQTSEISLIHDGIILGLRDYFKKSGFKNAVLGLSGGLDSALVAALACEALGPENVLAVLMPSVYSSDHSLKDALDLVNNTGCQHRIIPIKDIASAFESTLGETFAGREADTTEENIQARIRGTLLMAISNKFGNIVLNTSNKSEAAVGYGT